MNVKNPEREAEQALRKCLDEVPFLKVRRPPARRNPRKLGAEPDILFELQLPRGNKFLFAKFKKSGQPRLAREASNDLLRLGTSLPGSYGVFLAPYISPRAAEICTREGIGYLDLAGNCRIVFGQVYISREGRPNPFAKKRGIRSLYSPKAARVLRVLLVAHPKIWRTRALAREAEVSLGQVSNVKKLLADREWVRTGSDGLTLAEPEPLLAEWSENYDLRRNTVVDFYSMMDTGKIESRLARVCRKKGVEYALTGFSAAARIAPAVRYQRATAYVNEPSEELVRELGLKRVSSGPNVSLLIPYDEGVFYAAQKARGVRMVSAVQAYLDLRGFRGRGEEAAEFLLERIVRPQWRGVRTTRKRR